MFHFRQLPNPREVSGQKTRASCCLPTGGCSTDMLYFKCLRMGGIPYLGKTCVELDSCSNPPPLGRLFIFVFAPPLMISLFFCNPHTQRLVLQAGHVLEQMVFSVMVKKLVRTMCALQLLTTNVHAKKRLLMAMECEGFFVLRKIKFVRVFYFYFLFPWSIFLFFLFISLLTFLSIFFILFLFLFFYLFILFFFFHQNERFLECTVEKQRLHCRKRQPSLAAAAKELGVSLLCLDHQCVLPGCTDPEACNFAGAATYDDQSCEYNTCLDECESNPCENGGTCIDDLLMYTCECTDLYEGTHCETRKITFFFLYF